MDPKDKTGEFPFKWVNSSSTNIAETFKRIRERNAAPRAPADRNAESGLDVSPAAAAPISIASRRKA